MFYYLYEVKNNLNGKIYVGVHKTKSLDDGYMGSGKVIRHAIKKHGVENFTKVILEQFDNSVAMYAREKEVVTDEFLLREDVYNLRRGGFGGFEYINKTGLNFKGYASPAERSRHINPFLNKDRYSAEWHRIAKKNKTSAASKARKLGKGHNFSAIGSKKGCMLAATPKAIEKRKETFAKIGHQQGEKNSQAGTMWITNGKENKKIKKNTFIPCGWNKGRIQVTPF